MSPLAQTPTQSPIQKLMGVPINLLPLLYGWGHYADQSLPVSAKVNNV